MMKRACIFILALLFLVGCVRSPLQETPTEAPQEDTAELTTIGSGCNQNKTCESYYCHFEDISIKTGVCADPSMMQTLLNPNGETRNPDPLSVTMGSGEVTIANDVLVMVVTIDGLIISMVDTRTGQVRTTQYLDGFTSARVIVEYEQVSLLYALSDDVEAEVTVQLEENNVYLTLTMPESFPMQEMTFPGPIKTVEGEWMVLPRAAGMLLPVDDVDLWGFSFYSWKSSMNFIGILDADLDTGYLFRVDESWDTEVYFENSGSAKPVLPYIIHLGSKGSFAQPRHITYTFMAEGGYVSMAQEQRKYAEQMGYVSTLSEKIEDNPNVEKLIGAADFYLGCGSMEIINSLPDYGFDRALINFHGGYYVAENCPTDIQVTNALGYLTGRYDIFTDVWNPDEFTDDWVRNEGYPEDVIVTEDGALQEGWLHKEGGLFGKEYQGYYTSSATHLDHALPRIEEDLANQPYSARFIDVELASMLMEDYSEIHPATREADMYYRMQALDMVKNGFGLVTGSEEFHEWAIPFLDYSEGTMTIWPDEDAGYDWATPVEKVSDEYEMYNINPYYRIPLHGLVYHDAHIATWYTGDGGSKVPAYWDEKDLLNALYGTMPLYMPPDGEYWGKNLTRFVDSYHIAGLVFRETGLAKMIDHRFLTEDRLVQETEFDNGWIVTANFSDEEYVDNRYPYPLAPKGLYASDGMSVIAKVMLNGVSTIYVELEDRIYLHPLNGEVEFAGLRTRDAVLLLWQKTGGYQLTLVDGQTSIELNTIDIPMKLSIGHFEDASGDWGTFDDLSNGWIEVKVDKNANVIYWVDDLH